jgi:predicted DCC family thiol-disulfide oxidoreductase YuxK
MERLLVLYDAECGFCWRVKAWLRSQPAYLKLEFLAQQSAEAHQRYGELIEADDGMEVIVVADDGRVYRGDRGYIMCLYALKRYRRWSYRLASLPLQPLARNAFAMLTRHRHALSRLLGKHPTDEELRSVLERHMTPRCGAVPSGSA